MTIGPIRVLYVDDDEALARLVQKRLGRQGFDVIQARTGEGAIDAVAAQPFDVIALDHYLANTTGLEILARLSASGLQSPPVVYVTGSTEMSVAVAALKAGATDFVPKTIGDEFLELLAAALHQAVGKSRLIAEKAAAEQEVRSQRDRAEMLLSEVNHRVANSLALVSSLVSLQTKSLPDGPAKDALTETQSRIYAIAQVHKRLYSSGDFRYVALEEYLSGLLDHLRSVMMAEGHSAVLVYSLGPMQVSTDAAVNLGVIVTEWVTNAFKYAFPADPGTIRVSLRTTSGNQSELVVEDDGVGLGAPAQTRGTGLGTRIVKAMAMSLNGDVDYMASGPGTSARISFTVRSQ